MHQVNIDLGGLYVCQQCNKHVYTSTYKACGRCSGVYYCSSECQKLDWKRHKLKCTLQAKELATLATEILNRIREKYSTCGFDLIMYLVEKKIEYINKNFTLFFTVEEAQMCIKKGDVLDNALVLREDYLYGECDHSKHPNVVKFKINVSKTPFVEGRDTKSSDAGIRYFCICLSEKI